MTKMTSVPLKSRPGGGAKRGLQPSVIAYKRERILEVASALIHAKGYDAATMEMVADELQVTKPFLYTYFRNKSDILRAICEVGVSESLAALDRVAETDGTSVDRLRTSLGEVARIIIERYQYIDVYQREIKSLDRASAQHLIRLRHEFDLRIGRMIQACVDDGYVTVTDAPAMSVWIGGLMSWITNCYRPGSRRSRETVIEQVVTASLRIIGLQEPVPVRQSSN
jgi:AcrR family transcriptional regulator